MRLSTATALVLVLFVGLVCGSDQPFFPMLKVAPGKEASILFNKNAMTQHFLIDVKPDQGIRSMTVTLHTKSRANKYSYLEYRVQRGAVPTLGQACNASSDDADISIRPYSCWSARVHSPETTQRIVMNFPVADRYYGLVHLKGDPSTLVSVLASIDYCPAGFVGQECKDKLISATEVNPLPYDVSTTLVEDTQEYHVFEIDSSDRNAAKLTFNLFDLECPEDSDSAVFIRYGGYPVYDPAENISIYDTVFLCREGEQLIDWINPTSGKYYVMFYGGLITGNSTFNFNVNWLVCSSDFTGSWCSTDTVGPLCDHGSSRACRDPYLYASEGSTITEQFNTNPSSNKAVVIRSDVHSVSSVYELVATVNVPANYPYLNFTLLAKRNGIPLDFPPHSTAELNPIAVWSSPKNEPLVLRVPYAKSGSWAFVVALHNSSIPANQTYHFSLSYQAFGCYKNCSKSGTCDYETNFCKCSSGHVLPACTKSNAGSRAGTAVGVVFLILGVGVLAGAGYVIYQRKMRERYERL